jgi:hypothetical protein
MQNLIQILGKVNIAVPLANLLPPTLQPVRAITILTSKGIPTILGRTIISTVAKQITVSMVPTTMANHSPITISGTKMQTGTQITDPIIQVTTAEIIGMETQEEKGIVAVVEAVMTEGEDSMVVEVDLIEVVDLEEEEETLEVVEVLAVEAEVVEAGEDKLVDIN